jgi:catechol 2,3-dioxygenase-like lactoylglutathione lyase family enzyme
VTDQPYVMPAYVKLLCADAARSRRFYQALGFTLQQQDSVFTHLRWRRYADLFLVSTPSGLSFEERRGSGVLICFSVTDGSLEDLAERARGEGAAVSGPSLQPWHTRELLITDPDGYRLAFVQPG